MTSVDYYPYNTHQKQEGQISILNHNPKPPFSILIPQPPTFLAQSQTHSNKYIIKITRSPMLNKIPQPSPLRKRETTYNSFPSFQAQEDRFSEQKNQPIPSLITKFVHLSSQIEIQHNISSFNLIEYQKQDGKGVFDENLANAKLRRIENNAELKRANMELFMRKRKMHKIREQKHKQNFVKEEANKESKSQYKDIFKTFAQGKGNKDQDDNDSLEEENKVNDVNMNMAPTAEGILYFNELKKHPKLLNYTIEKVKAKNVQSEREKYQKRDRILKFRNQMRTVSHSQPRITNKEKIAMESLAYQPQVIFENMFRKIYTKKNHNKSISEARSDRRLNQFMTKQEEILEGINQKSLSKQNYKKLKERLDDLLNQLYQVDKKHRIQQNNQKKASQTLYLFRPQRFQQH